MALRAYRHSLQGSEAPVIDGLTGEQRFFSGWAQVARQDPRRGDRSAGGNGSALTAGYRVLRVLVNSDDFVEAFDVQPGDGMWRQPEERVRIW